MRVDEAALLAAIVRAPNRDNPRKRPDLVRTRRAAILAVMPARGWIDDAQYRDGVARGVELGKTFPELFPRVPAARSIPSRQVT